MKVFTVHAPPGESAANAERLSFVKEGFCWPALFIPFIWMLWHAMWWVMLGWLVVGLLLGVVANLLPDSESAIAVLSALFTVWFALEANGLRRWSLTRKGWRMVGIATGRGREDAERSYFARAGEALAPPPGAAAPAVPPLRPGRTVRAGEPGIGLFPYAER